ncbi:uncharacterized protein [Henckelia pumila]|uniref:uncharacterized protein n=1 Tax=Henckelia pumila TaxID=405737 RepID=UPI003C6E0146
MILRSGKGIENGPISPMKAREGKDMDEEVEKPYEKQTKVKSTSSPSGISNAVFPPFPARLEKSRKADYENEVLETFRKVEINIPLIDAIKKIPRYANFFKYLCTNKISLRNDEKGGSSLTSRGPNSKERPFFSNVGSWKLVLLSKLCYYKILEDREKTNFTCPFGTFANRCMPFGPCNAPGIMLGHVVYSRGIEVDKSKIDIITKLPYATNVKEVQDFLGHGVLLEFWENCKEAFDKLKNMLTTAPIIKPSDLNLPFDIMCDSSNYVVDIVNYLVNEIFPSSLSKSRKDNIRCETKNYEWHEPDLWKFCADQVIRRCVPENEYK